MDLKPSGARSAADEGPMLSSINTAEEARPMVVDEPPAPETESPITKDAEPSPTPRRTSVKQSEANRKNALRSTGPTTPEGKQVSRFNALRHGLRAKEVIIPGQEYPAEFDAILRELCEDWEPEGHTERHLVEQIGLAEWRLRRAHRAELGEIRTQMASRMASEASEVEYEIKQAFQRDPERLPHILAKSTTGIAYLREAVEDAFDELESEGTVSEVSIDELERVFGEEADSPVTMLKVWFVEEMPEGNEEDLDSDGEPRRRRRTSAKKKAAARKHLEMTLKDLDRQERKLHKQERTDLEIVRQRLSIPQASELETIQRYETAIKRDMYRAIDQLEHLQRRRRGEPPPPTVNVNVSCDDDD